MHEFACCEGVGYYLFCYILHFPTCNSYNVQRMRALYDFGCTGLGDDDVGRDTASWTPTLNILTFNKVGRTKYLQAEHAQEVLLHLSFSLRYFFVLVSVLIKDLSPTGVVLPSLQVGYLSYDHLFDFSLAELIDGHTDRLTLLPLISFDWTYLPHEAYRACDETQLVFCFCFFSLAGKRY
jgi:hypothetical protein